MTDHVAFYAPLKPPSHPTPSGDRRFARLLLQALRRAGFDARTASTLRSRNPDGDTEFQRRLEKRADTIVDRLLQRYRDDRPAVWFTYHVYYKAPDLLGPPVARALNIPYVIAEASRAARRADGPWQRGHALTDEALRQADLILQPNPKDLPEVTAFLGPGAPVVRLPPFLDAGRETRERRHREQYRTEFAARFGLNPDRPWLISTGMMRPGAKRESYRVLARAISTLDRQDVHWLMVGDGPERPEIERDFSGDSRVRFTGALPARALSQLNAAADLYVWPAIDEAFGMAPLEAQAAGLPVVLGDRPGTRAMVRPDETGLLTPEGDPDALRLAVRSLLDAPERLAAMSDAAHRHVMENHDIAGAAERLRTCLQPLIDGRNR